MTDAPLSVVVATRDRPTHLSRCLAALAGELSSEDEILVVDSASRHPRDVAGVVEGMPGPAGMATTRLIRAPRPGTSLARNLGGRAGAHELVAFVDDDVEVLPGWADALRAAFAHPAVWFVTGWIGVPAEQVGVAEPNPLMVAPEPFVIDRRRRGLVGASANFACRRAALLAAGGFDERLGPGTWRAAGEDHEFIDRLLRRGYTGAYTPAARVQHDQWRSRRDSLKLHWRMGKGAGARLARLTRNDPGRLPAVGRELVVDDILTAIMRSLREGYQTGTVFAVLRLLGLLLGYVAALPTK